MMQNENRNDRLNCCIISIIIVDVCTEVLRHLLNDIIANPGNYPTDLNRINFYLNYPFNGVPIANSTISSITPIAEFNRRVNSFTENYPNYPSPREFLKYNRDCFTKHCYDILNRIYLTGEMETENEQYFMEKCFDIKKIIKKQCLQTHRPERQLLKEPVLKIFKKNYHKCDTSQIQTLYPNGEPAKNFDDFDLSLCVRLLRFILKWPEKPDMDMSRWAPPLETDYTIQADIKRLLMIRNDHYAHKSRFTCDDSQLAKLEGIEQDTSFAELSVLAKIECVIQRLVKDQQKLEKLILDINNVFDLFYSQKRVEKEKDAWSVKMIECEKMRNVFRENMKNYEKRMNKYKEESKRYKCELESSENKIQKLLSERNDKLQNASNRIKELFAEVHNRNKKLKKANYRLIAILLFFLISLDLYFFCFLPSSKGKSSYSNSFNLKLFDWTRTIFEIEQDYKMLDSFVDVDLLVKQISILFKVTFKHLKRFVPKPEM